MNVIYSNKTTPQGVNDNECHLFQQVKSNINRKCVKDLDLTPFKFVQALPTTRTSFEEAEFEFGD